MAELDILSIVATPTLKLAVEFVPADPTPASYTVTAVAGAATYTASGAGPVISVQVLKYGVEYTVTVTAVTPNQTGVSSTVTPAPVVSNSAVLRQKLYDIVAGAGLTMDGRSLLVLADKYQRPRSFSKEPKSTAWPVLEVRIPKLNSTTLASGFRRREAWDVDLYLSEASEDSDQAVERLTLLMDKIRNAVDGVQNLGLAYLSIVDDGWSWSAPLDPIDNNKVQTLPFRLTVMFDVQVTKLPYARV